MKVYVDRASCMLKTPKPQPIKEAKLVKAKYIHLDKEEKIWVVSVTSLKQLIEIVNGNGAIILEPYDGYYKGIDYRLIIYDDYME